MNIKIVFSVMAVFIVSVVSAQNVGIGTSSPAAKLDITSTNSGVLIPRVALTGTRSASPLTSPAASTMVYNTATAGSGATAVTPGFYYWNGSSSWIRVIDASSLSSATSVSNTVSGNTISTTVDGVPGSAVTVPNIYTGDGTLAGNRTVTQAADNITFSSTTGNFVYNSSGGGNVNLGNGNTVSSTFGTALGFANTASGQFSTAMGSNSTASGKGSFTNGYGLTAASYNETALGTSNTTYTPTSATTWSATDRLFGIGNGSSPASPSDAFVILKNGNTGIGTSSPNGTLAVVGKGIFGDNTVTNNDANDNLYLERVGSYTQMHLYNNDGSNTDINSYISENTTGSNSGFGNTTPGLNIWTASAHPIRLATSATQRMVILSTGNVGINVTAPTSTLQVGGTTTTTNFQMTNGATSGYLLQSDASGNATWTPASSIAANNIYNSDGTLTGTRTVTMGNNNLIFNTSGTGNVVVGTGEASGAPTGGILRGPNAGSGNTAGGNLTLNAGFAFGAGAGGSVFVNGGTSGSGTNGNIYLRGGYSSGAEGAVYVNDDHSGTTFLNGSGGTVNVGRTSAGGSQVNINNGLTIDNAAANTGSISNSNVTTGSGITFGTSSGEGIASNRANAAATQNEDGIDIYTNFTRRLSVGNTGLIGIGTAGNITPYQQLTVLSSGLWSNSETGLSGISTLTGASTSDYILYMGADKTNALSYIQSVHYGTAIANLGLNERGGYVGIGTGSSGTYYAPTTALAVNGSGGIWNNNLINFYTDNGSTQKGYVGMYTTAGSDFSIASTGSGNWLRLGTNSGSIAFFPDGTLVGGANPKMMLLTSGYLGIGTASPTSTLDVRGNINLNQNELYISGNNDNNHHIIYNSTYDGPEISGCAGVSIATGCYSSPLAVFYHASSTSSYTVFTAYAYVSAGEYYSHYYNKYMDIMNDLDSIDHIRPMLAKNEATGEPEVVNDISTYPSATRALTKEGTYNTNVGNLASLNTGAIRELRAETKSRDRMLEDRIDRLENLVSQLSGSKLGEMEFTGSSVAYKDVDSYFIVDARIKPSSVISISGLSGYTIVNQSEGGFGIRFASAPASDIRFTYSSKY